MDRKTQQPRKGEARQGKATEHVKFRLLAGWFCVPDYHRRGIGNIHVASFPFRGQRPTQARRSLEGGVGPLFSARSESFKMEISGTLWQVRVQSTRQFARKRVDRAAHQWGSVVSCRLLRGNGRHVSVLPEPILVAVTRKARIFGSWYGT